MKSEAAAQHWRGPCLRSELLSLLTAVQSDFIWEQGRMDELADLELPSAFSIRTQAVLSPSTDEVTSHVTASTWGPTLPHVIQSNGGEGLARQRAITCAALMQPLPSSLAPLQSAIACSDV